ncbi:MAG: hypothetical protein PVI86_07050 [Phycisphaerae bacterium]|jgi:hypothetical protein
MRARKAWGLSLLITLCAALSGGCVDVIVDGVARGVNISVQTIVQDLFAALVDRVVNPPTE